MSVQLSSSEASVQLHEATSVRGYGNSFCSSTRLYVFMSFKFLIIDS